MCPRDGVRVPGARRGVAGVDTLRLDMFRWWRRRIGCNENLRSLSNCRGRGGGCCRGRISRFARQRAATFFRALQQVFWYLGHGVLL